MSPEAKLERVMYLAVKRNRRLFGRDLYCAIVDRNVDTLEGRLAAIRARGGVSNKRDWIVAAAAHAVLPTREARSAESVCHLLTALRCYSGEGFKQRADATALNLDISYLDRTFWRSQ